MPARCTLSWAAARCKIRIEQLGKSASNNAHFTLMFSVIRILCCPLLSLITCISVLGSKCKIKITLYLFKTVFGYTRL